KLPNALRCKALRASSYLSETARLDTSSVRRPLIGGRGGRKIEFRPDQANVEPMRTIGAQQHVTAFLHRASQAFRRPFPLTHGFRPCDENSMHARTGDPFALYA